MDSLLVAEDEHLVDVIDENQPATSPEMLGAVNRTPTNDAKVGTAGMAPPEGSGGVLWEGEGQCQGPSPVDLSHLYVSRCSLFHGPDRTGLDRTHTLLKHGPDG